VPRPGSAGTPSAPAPPAYAPPMPARPPMAGAPGGPPTHQFGRPSGSNPVAPARPATPLPQPTTSSTPRAAGAGNCRYCSGSLPAGRSITFCPHCGQNLTIQHCPACSTELEVGWKFCTTCGRNIGATT
jgi:hypothetical protein